MNVIEKNWNSLKEPLSEPTLSVIETIEQVSKKISWTILTRNKITLFQDLILNHDDEVNVNTEFWKFKVKYIWMIPNKWILLCHPEYENW